MTDGRLTVSSLRVELGGVVAVANLSMSVQPGQIVGLIGPNGAGKTTAVNAITGYVRPTGGTVTIGSEVVSGRSPEQLATAGLARTFQGARLFSSMTVQENVMVAAAARHRGAAVRRAALGALERVGLSGAATQSAQGKPAGVQRTLGLARALALEPRFLLLDEPAAGLNDTETDGLIELLASLASDDNLGLLVIEHDMRLIMGLCHSLYVLDSGQTIFTGTPAQARTDPDVITAYLGSTAA